MSSSNICETTCYIYIYIYMRWVQVIPGVTLQKLHIF